ncbi:thymidylate synthase [Staphylococcus phage MVC_VPHSA2]|uniref:Thymidylate synthase n=1 Tax=Staphylococcus phage MVC_VPHSA1 TaxID=3088876 RepID=A0ABZ0QYQ7_9CAUD|nr:thymidylate synthase [Staphylococcus phage MVC_VPHSA1]WPF65013.1 thymidylate synthase [Staphylococcus phage MVC_VPHSA2]
MKVTLIGHTQLSQEFKNELIAAEKAVLAQTKPAGQHIALTAIRTCYSANKPSEIVALEGDKYFKEKATEGEGKEIDRLIRMIVHSGHTSTLEHISFIFAVEDVSRALLAQLTRHRVGFGFSVQSQRYVKQSSDSKHGSFGYVVPEKVNKNDVTQAVFEQSMQHAQRTYDTLIKCGVPQEDARAVLPQAATCNLTLSVNLRALLDFYSKRMTGKGAQQEITVLAEKLKEEVVKVEPWIEGFFGGAK